jgi:hypothetical protein
MNQPYGDEGFERATAMSVRAHHWPFGEMSAVEGVARLSISHS